MLIYVLAGTLGPTLVVSKIAPLAQLEEVEKVVIIWQGEEIPIPKCEWRRLRVLFRQSKHPLNSAWRGLMASWKLLVESLRRKPDVILGIYPIPYGWIALCVAKLIGRPVVVQIIGASSQLGSIYQFKKFWELANLWMLRHCDLVATKGSRTTSYLAAHGIAPRRIVEFTGSIDFADYGSAGETERDIDMLYVGRFVSYKGVERVVEITSALAKTLPALQVVMLGDGRCRPNVEKLIELSGLSAIVTLPGHVPDVVGYCRRAKVFILPSLTEGLSTAMMEAMAAGAVPVVSNVGNQTDGAKHGVNALVVDAYDDIGRYVEYVEGLLKDEERRRQLSQQAAAFARANWSRSVEGARWRAALDMLKQIDTHEGKYSSPIVN